MASLRSFDAIRYAQKACSNIHILKLIREEGGLLDAVSFGELQRGLAAGYPTSATMNWNLVK
ncbi:MAG: Diaminopimelate decarboxylase (EC [uncultured Caballeronia sp.]|nr:MAG: Diaminopimelate decarboxylase (EC [uncultured Caballeronia sp.]